MLPGDVFAAPPGIEVPNDFYPLPAAPDLPILLGARMSLSFPILLSAVPLYAANVTQRNEQGKFELERCLFSDGGLTSNFPIHFFDAPLPTRSTFGINLVPENVAIGDTTTEEKSSVTGLRPGGEPVEGDHKNSWKNIYMPTTNASGIGSVARFNEFTTIVGFFSALFDTARDLWPCQAIAIVSFMSHSPQMKAVSISGCRQALSRGSPSVANGRQSCSPRALPSNRSSIHKTGRR